MRTAVSVGLLLSSLACARSSTAPPSDRAAAPATAAANQPLAPGAFRLELLPPEPDGSTGYRAFTAAEAHCEFVVRLRQSTSGSAGPIDFTSARLERRNTTDCSEFLRALAPELGFTGPLPTPEPLPSLDLEAALLGTHQSRSNGPYGGFSSKPPGSWQLLKLFFNDDEGEIFLNLNPEEGVGEFTPKDEEYATVVVTELSKILLPSRHVAQPVVAADAPKAARR